MTTKRHDITISRNRYPLMLTTSHLIEPPLLQPACHGIQTECDRHVPTLN
ncbi:hypothetical protein M2318_001992 [Metapseudomonas resinovorans]